MGWIPKGWTPQSVDSIIEIDPAVNLPKNTVALFVDMKALPLRGYSVTAINKNLMRVMRNFKAVMFF